MVAKQFLEDGPCGGACRIESSTFGGAATAYTDFSTVHKPHGIIQPRVQQVGPERFGIVSVDCARARFKWMLCDFYGHVLVPPTVVEHNRVELELALVQLDNLTTPHLAS